MPRVSKPKPVVKPIYTEELTRWEAGMRVKGLIPVTLYTDGSCPENAIRPGEAPMGAGIVALSGSVRKEWSIPLGGGTNIIAELRAIQLALTKITDPSRCAVQILTDSQFSINALTLTHWKLKKNVELILATRLLLGNFKTVAFCHVDGHDGNEGNERCDLLAGTAVKSQIAWRGVWVSGVRTVCEPIDHCLGTDGH